MNKIRLFILAALVVLPGLLSAQEVTVNEARFQQGDNPDWAAPAYDDSAWTSLSLDKEWDYQGVSNPGNYAWYRIHVRIPLSIKKRLPFPGKVLVNLGCIDDCDETWLNGSPIGKTGTLATDPDMLVVGKVGWSDNLRESRLTPAEQYTHISIWSLLASNMLIGCDISQIDDFTFNLLCNNEVNAVNQDVLGKQAHQDVDEDGMQIWSRPLSDGGVAVGIFNMNEQPVPVLLSGALAKIGLKAEKARDLWCQQDIPTDETYIIPAHGVRYVKVGWGCER